jgi:hypothetical protein
MRRIAAVSAVAVVALAGCGAGSRSVLYSGVSFGISQKRTVISDAAAVRDARVGRVEWLGMVARARAGVAGRRFPNVPEREFRRRLDMAARRYGFTLERVAFRHAGQVTPFVVVRTRRYVAFARSVHAIEKVLDPHRGSNDRTGWTLRAFFLEADDERGVPFLAVSNVVDAGSVAGGQWARSDPLYPFGHG